ncbi:MAG: hypothetical protein M1838_005902 [Thelocarpon superellum]|nr:MAG: hypothetical protein M1838_005902 [Thelocarpon superellum]
MSGTLATLESPDASYQLSHLNESRQGSLMAVNISMVIISTAAVALRLLARRLARVGLSWDDYIILAAQALAYACFGVLIPPIQLGLGKHTFSIPLDDLIPLGQYHYIFNMCYAFALPVVKFSIIFFLYRTFPTQGFRRVCVVFGWFMFTAWIANLFPAIWICRPISYYWDKFQEGSCFDEERFLIATSGLTILFDLVLLFIPLPLVWTLRVSPQQKVALMFIFTIGGFVCVFSALRIPFIHLLFSDDPLYDGYWPAVGSLLELNMGIVAACLPVLRPVVRLIGKLAGADNVLDSRQQLRPSSHKSFGFPSFLSQRRGSDGKLLTSPSTMDESKGGFSGLTTLASPSIPHEHGVDGGDVEAGKVEVSTQLQDLGNLATEPEDLTAERRVSESARAYHGVAAMPPRGPAPTYQLPPIPAHVRPGPDVYTPFRPR